MKKERDQPLPKWVDSESDYGSDNLLGSCVGSNIFGRTVFGFISPVIRMARTEGKLHEDDVPEHTMDLDTKVLYDRFSKEWQIQRTKKNPSMSSALAAGRWHLLFLTGLGYIVAQALSLAGPQLLKQIVQGLTCRQLRNASPGVEVAGCEGGETRLYLFACGLFIAPLAQAFIETHNVYVLEQLGLVFRNSLMGAIYRKTLKLNSEALNAASTGKIVTLMSNDAQKLQEVMMSIHTAWGAPLFIIAILILLYAEIQWAAFVGLGAMFCLVPASTFIGKKLGTLRRKIVGFTDKRTSYMGEIINGIRVIKFYAWELPFRQRVRDVRGQEAKVMRTMATYQAFFGLTLFVGPVMVSIASFAAYTGAGNELTPTKAYTSLALFTLLRFPLAFLPSVIFNVINAKIALNRIAKFLMSGEVLEEDENFITKDVTPGYVEIQNGVFSWGSSETEDSKAAKDAAIAKANVKNGKAGKDAQKGRKRGGKGKGKDANESKGTDTDGEHADAPKEDKPALHDINLKCEPGSLTMVVGAVGSGKSSLLATLFQQITRMQGSVKVGGSVAYVPQTAWIMNETVRENVLMGAPLDERRYEKALRCAQLASDLAQLSDGDQTEIGERGVTLSGGQKQRVSIARAVYADADVVIMDDPLSAVDAHVGKALFEDCLVHELGDKTVVLVTNALHFLHVADQVVWIVDGRLRKVGTYKELSDDDEFMELVGSQVVAEDVNSEEEADEDGAAADGGAAALPQSEGHMINKQVEKKGLTGTEERTVGALSWGVISLYIMAGGGIMWVGLVLFLYVLEQGSKIMTDTWVGWWSTDRLDQGKSNLLFYLGIYAAIAVGFGMITLARSLHFSYGAVRAAVNLHNALVDRVLRLPVSFFDTNPSGRIINRFSRDTEIMDSVLPLSLVQVGACTFSYFGILAVISIATPWFVLMLPPVTVVYYFLQRYYIPAARELQRLESVTRSPIYSGFGEAVNGIATIRAFNKASHFVQLEDHLISNNGLLFLTQRAGTAWLSLRLDAIGLTVLTAAGLLAVASKIDPSFAGLSLIYALDLTKFLKFGTRIASKTETDFNSVERIAQYLEEEEEADPETPADPDTKKWPTKGEVQVKKVVMRYRPNLPAVLRSVSFFVTGGEHVGIVGRTGSGKSSLFLVFFRIVEPEAGKVVIDGVNIGRLGLTTLRKSLSMIPQDPFMFSGSVRRNLDPFDNYSDVEVWQALEAVSLKPTIEAFDEKLEATVTDNGGNFSQGQRQLFCLARALLKNSRILMMDEATASVDLETDALIQKVIRDKFANCTVLTIAHRLNTIMDSDKVLVMDAGQAAEYASPHELLQDPDSLFTGLVENTGKNAAKVLKDMANASHARAGDNMYHTAESPPSDPGYYDITAPPPASNLSQQSQRSQSSGRRAGGYLRTSGDGTAAGPPNSMTYEGSSSDYFGVPAPGSRRSSQERRRSLGSNPYPLNQDEQPPRSSCEVLPPVYEDSLVGGLVAPFSGNPASGPGYTAVPEAALYSWYSASIISGEDDSEYRGEGSVHSQRRMSSDNSRRMSGAADRPGSSRSNPRSHALRVPNIRWTGTQNKQTTTDTTSWVA